MTYILPAFKAFSTIFACLAVATGAQALWDPIGFAASFGIPIHHAPRMSTGNSTDTAIKQGRSDSTVATAAPSCVSLIGVRQLATGVTLVTFAWQGRLDEMAVLPFVLGFLVAGTDGLFFYRSRAAAKGLFHAGPGAGIAMLAGAVGFSRS